MRRTVRIASCLAVMSFSAAILAAGSATAAGASTVSAAVIAAHGLGALPPTGHVAPRVAALDVPPVSVDLRKWAVTPGDQGAVSSCVTWAIDYSLLGWYTRYAGRTGAPFAPMYTYSQIDGGVDGGSYPTAALGIAQTQGSDTRADYTQGDYDWRDQPTLAEHTNAAKYKITGYETLFIGANQPGSTLLVKDALAANHPVAIEMAVRNGFEGLGPSANAVDNDITSAILGYHEVLAVGYDAAGLIIENSWGTGWANGGFGRLSWRVVQTDVVEGDTIDGLVPAPPAPPTAPTVAAPTITELATAGKGANATVSYKLAWKAKTGTSGAITRYDAWLQTDGKALLGVTLTTATSTTFTLAAQVGHRYRFAVRARAGATVGAVTFTTTFTAAVARPGATLHA